MSDEMINRNSPNWCEECGEDVGWGSHYHCARCGIITGMYGCYTGSGFACRPEDVARYEARKREREQEEGDGMAAEGGDRDVAPARDRGGEGQAEGAGGCQGCKCGHCNESRDHDGAFARRDPDELIAIIKGLRNRLICAEEDNCRYAGIMDGSWPSAGKILIEALEKVSQKPG